MVKSQQILSIEGKSEQTHEKQLTEVLGSIVNTRDSVSSLKQAVTLQPLDQAVTIEENEDQVMSEFNAPNNFLQTPMNKED